MWFRVLRWILSDRIITSTQNIYVDVSREDVDPAFYVSVYHKNVFSYFREYAQAFSFV